MAQSDGCDSWKSRSQDHTRGSKRKLTMNFALLVPLFSSLYSGASLTPLSQTVPEGNGIAILLPLADPRAMVTST
jgi:hypothetical protein